MLVVSCPGVAVELAAGCGLGTDQIVVSCKSSVPTDLIANPVFTRQVPAPAWAWPVAILTAVLAGVLIALPRPASCRPATRTGIIGGGLAYLAMFAPLAFVLVLQFGVNRLSTSAAQGLYWAFCVAMGASLTNIFIIYTGESVVRVFFITAATFGASVKARATEEQRQHDDAGPSTKHVPQGGLHGQRRRATRVPRRSPTRTASRGGSGPRGCSR